MSEEKDTLPVPSLKTLHELFRVIQEHPEGKTVSVKEAATLSGVSERTLRRYIAGGSLPTTIIKGARGKEHQVDLKTLASLLQSRQPMFAKAASSPVNDLQEEVELLRHQLKESELSLIESMRSPVHDLHDKLSQLVQQVKDSERSLIGSLENQNDMIEKQNYMIDQLRAELRDSRAQVHQLQDQMLKVLMPPKKKAWWKLRSEE